MAREERTGKGKGTCGSKGKRPSCIYEKNDARDETEQTNPALAEVLKKDLALKQKRNDLLEQIKGTTDEAKKKELTNQLKTVVGDSFDLIVQKKQLKYEELKKKLEELQQNVKKSQSELESIKSKKTEQVEQRLKELLSQSEKIDWD
jgi:chromosome segregation ATPase